MKSFSDIIDALGGTTAAAQWLGTTPQNARWMARNNSILPKYWPAITKALPKVKLATLAEIAAKPKKGNGK